MPEDRIPYRTSADFAAAFIVGVDWAPAGTIGFELDELLARGRGYFTPAQARSLAAVLRRRADALAPRPPEPSCAEVGHHPAITEQGDNCFCRRCRQWLPDSACGWNDD